MKAIVRQFLRREAHPFIQFIKYGMAGGFATLVDIVCLL
jgi:putative flippase GtrA